MTPISLLVLAYFVLLIGLTLFFSVKESPLWKSALIVLVLSLLGLSLWFPGEDGYGPDDRLIPGLDLAGGTVLVYDVKVPKNRDATRVIDDTIAILSKRVDPTGTKNLVWRQVAGKRLEVQMPLPNKETGQRREAFLEAKEAVIAGNIPVRQIESILRQDAAQRDVWFTGHAGGNAGLLADFQTLAQASDSLVKATKDNDQAQADYDQAQADVKALPSSANQSKREKARASADDLRKVLQDKALTYLDAKDAFDAAEQRVLGRNISEFELDRLRELPNTLKAQGKPSTRRSAVDQLVAEHTERADQINKLFEAYAAYEQVKGVLDDPDDLITLLQGSGVLEFRIVPGSNDPGVDIGSYRQQLSERGPRAGRDRAWVWSEIDDIEKYINGAENLPALEQDPAGFFASSQGQIGQRYADTYYVLLANVPSLAMTQDQDWGLRTASPTIDDMGAPAVAFSLNALGGERMSQITGPNVGKPMAILLDGKVISSPNLNSKISGSGVITGGSGGFGQDELYYLLNTLKAGSLEGELGEYPISIKTIDAKFGKDNIDHGYTAARDALIIVALFMLAYYMFAGLVADFALIANMILILGVMATMRSTFTLPGIAGIVLTIGMAVDANVLIFERIREEMQRGADLTTSVRLGYEKALSTILDANITTLITCIVLGYTATVEIKGFAVTLGIGILATLFTALFCTRVFLELYLIYGKAKTLPMLPTLIPGIGRLLHPNVNWVRIRYVFFAISTVVVIAGLGLVYERGEDMLDIEFRSGTQVSMTLAKGKSLPLEELRERLRNYGEAGLLIAKGKQPDAELEDAYRNLVPIAKDARDRYEKNLAEAQAAAADPSVRGVAYPKKVDFSLFSDTADSGIITEGAQEGPGGVLMVSAFNVSTLVEDSQAVSAVIKAAFSDVLDTKRPVTFASIDIDEVNNAPVYPVRSAVLGESINRAVDVRTDVADYLGGVAVVLEDMSPAVTIEDLSERIERMRLQPVFEELGSRRYTVVGLDADETTAEGEQLYRSAVIVTRDTETNYLENPQTFADPGGLAGTEWRIAREACQRDTSLGSVSNFSSQVSGTMKQQAIVAMTLSLLAVVVYIWLRFGSITYGLAAIIALVHDVAIALGLVAVSAWVYNNSIGEVLMLEPFKIDLAMVAALLTIVGYSLNDTIVVFDRIRENRGRLSYATPSVINDSINQTISRTVLTSGTTLLAVGMLYVFGGAGVHGFAFAMIIGVVVGTYSSVAIASPVLMLGGERHVRADSPGTARVVTEK